ncbi:MAG TPA: hypothetical protein VMX17_14595, partial [Candidatus Glassbacteria bacterium]|nr:hypothetical protein [Candidatus Glassbacteria bacterium]
NNGGYSFKGTQPLQQDAPTKVSKPETIPESKVLWPPPSLPVSANIPAVVPPSTISPVIAPLPVVTPPSVVAPSLSKSDEGRGVKIDEIGRMRALIDEAEAVESGFTLKRPLYAMGTKVVDLGVDNFRRSRQEWEARPKVAEACNSLVETIKEEDRQDALWPMPEIYMMPDGRIGREDKKGSIILANSKVLGQLMNRSALETTGRGYLERCPPALRAMNVNSWLKMTTENVESKLRTRKVVDDREVFGVVSPRYSVFDADEVATIVRDVCPPEARAEVIYNGFDTRINVTFHSDIKPEDAVAGEIFKAGISIKTSDDGTGAIRVSAYVERNLCLNLIIIDTAVQQIINRRHTGDESIIADIIRNGIRSANDKVEVFAKKWGVANKEQLVASTVDLEHLKNDKLSPRFSLSHELFMAGLFNGLMERELVAVKGKRENIVDNLVEAWQKEPVMTKAGMVNAITRFAHEGDQKDPWMEDALQAQAGRLLFRSQPLPWLLPRESE